MQLRSRARKRAEWVFAILTMIWISVVPCYFLSKDARWDKLHLYGTIVVTLILAWSWVVTDAVLDWKDY